MNHFICKGKKVSFSSLRGEVMDTENHERTTVSSKIDIFHPNRTPSIETKVSTSSSFWFRTKEGQEKKFNLGSLRIPMRHGHDITIIFAEKEGTDTRHIAKIINHTSGETWTASSPGEMLISNLEFAPGGAAVYIALLLPPVITFFMLKSFFSSANTNIDIAGYIIMGFASLLTALPSSYAYIIPSNLFTKFRYSSKYQQSLDAYISSLKNL